MRTVAATPTLGNFLFAQNKLHACTSHSQRIVRHLAAMSNSLNGIAAKEYKEVTVPYLARRSELQPVVCDAYMCTEHYG